MLGSQDSSFYSRVQQIYGRCWPFRPGHILLQYSMQDSKVLAHPFLHFLDVMVTNSYLLYKLHLPEEERKKIYSQSISGEFGNSVMWPKRWFWKNLIISFTQTRVLGLLTSLHTLLVKSDNIMICAKYWRNPDTAPDWSVLHVICIFALNPTETASKFGILVNVTILGTKTCWKKYLFSARI